MMWLSFKRWPSYLASFHILHEFLDVLAAAGMPDASAPEAVSFEGLEHERQTAVLLPEEVLLVNADVFQEDFIEGLGAGHIDYGG